MKINKQTLAWKLIDDALPSHIAPWISYKQSMTSKVRALNSKTFHFNLRGEHPTAPSVFDQEALDIEEHEKIIIREIEMSHSGARCLYGRTISPASLYNSNPDFATLGSSPIGDVLFRTPTRPFTRRCYTELTPSDELYKAATLSLAHKPNSLWARYTLYPVHGKNLLIYEVFFPALLILETSHALAV